MKPNLERMRNTFVELVKIPSPSLRERDLADELKNRLTALGYEAQEDYSAQHIAGTAGNILVQVPATGKGAKLFLNAHIDTVETPGGRISPVVEGDIVKAKGDTILGADDKAGVTVLLEVLALLKKNKIRHGELLFGFTVAEEVELLGSSVMAEDWYEGFDAGITLDHSDPEEIVLAAPGKLAVTMTVNGVSGHGAFPQGKINAAHALAKVASRLPSGRLDEFSTCNLGLLHSGAAINVIPGQGYAEYEIRSHRKELLDFHLKNALTVIEGAIRECRVLLTDEETGETSVRRATVDVEVRVCYESYCLDESAAPVKILSQAIEKTGGERKLKIGSGGSDANIFNNRGLPTAVLGCGMHGAHSAGETANLREMARAVEILLAAVKSDLGLGD
jgi:tripeptide aminopeptidase